MSTGLDFIENTSYRGSQDSFIASPVQERVIIRTPEEQKEIEMALEFCQLLTTENFILNVEQSLIVASAIEILEGKELTREEQIQIISFKNAIDPKLIEL